MLHNLEGGGPATPPPDTCTRVFHKHVVICQKALFRHTFWHVRAGVNNNSKNGSIPGRRVSQAKYQGPENKSPKWKAFNVTISTCAWTKVKSKCLLWLQTLMFANKGVNHGCITPITAGVTRGFSTMISLFFMILLVFPYKCLKIYVASTKIT